MDTKQLKNILEAALLAAGRPLPLDEMRDLMGVDEGPTKQELRAALEELAGDYEGRGICLQEVASGYRIQVDAAMTPWLKKLWEERPPRYSRALLETLAIIAYRQPITRGDIEDVRGVSVSTNIMRTMLERGWVRVVGHRDVPGKPALYATTKEFLDYFSLKKLDDLPELADLQDMENLRVQLELDGAGEVGESGGPGSPQPLVRTAGADEEPGGQAEVASLDEARAAVVSHDPPISTVSQESGTVIPLKPPRG